LEVIQLDLWNAYVFCGAGSLTGALLMACTQADDKRLRTAVRLCCIALLITGVGLFQLIGASRPMPSAPSLWLANICSVWGMTFFAWSFMRLAGMRVQNRWMWGLLCGNSVVMLLAAPVGALLSNAMMVLLCTAMSVLMLWAQRGFIRAPRDRAERIMGWGTAVCALSWLLRWALLLSGWADATNLHASPNDLLRAQPLVTTGFALLYSATPMVVTTLVLGIVNARLRQQLRSRAMTDELTGVMTRRALRELFAALLGDALRREKQVAALMLDLDHFKTINDRYGHPAGDAVLRQVANTMQGQLRADALLARYGGEEFAIVTPVDDMRTARIIAERLRSAIANTPIAITPQIQLAVTVSIGVTMCTQGQALDMALLRADEALYRAKRAGRDRVEISITATDAPPGAHHNELPPDTAPGGEELFDDRAPPRLH
jgi:diguanylate cyclase (GGDEF)-like protein